MKENKWTFKKCLLLILIAIFAYWAIHNFSIVGNILGTIYNLIFPFILGGCIAFLINLPMAFFERKILKIKEKKNSKNKKNKRVKAEKKSKSIRLISLILALLVIILIFALIIRLIVPELINVIRMLIDNIPYYIDEVSKLVQKYGNDTVNINTIIENLKANTENIKNELINNIPTILTSSISIVSGIIGGIVTFVVAIIFAIYILIDKDKIQMQITKLLYAYLKKEKADKIIEIGKISNSTFRNFFSVQCLEAVILGSLCTIGMLILKIPFAVPIGILICVTSLIPVVGAFIGGAIGAILIVSVSPIKVVTFLIYLVILQQVEGNVIYPKVVGSSVGLPGMWVLVAVTLGGSLGGIVGTLIAVPIATVIYTLLKKDVNKKLEGKNEQVAVSGE